MNTIRIILATAAIAFAACDTLHVAGRLESPRGSIESDGKTVTFILPVK